MARYCLCDKFHLRICWHSTDSLTNEDELLEVHRMCYAFTPLLKRFESGFVDKLNFDQEGGEIDIYCDDVEGAIETVAPVMGCFPFMTEGFSSGCEPWAYYTPSGEESAEKIYVDLRKYLPGYDDKAEQTDIA